MIDWCCWGVERELADMVKEKERVEEERERLTILLEEERKKYEDLQFRWNIIKYSVVDPGSGAFFSAPRSGIRNGLKNQDPDPERTTHIIFPRAEKQFFVFKYFQFFYADPGWKKYSDPGSWINITDPQHWLNIHFLYSMWPGILQTVLGFRKPRQSSVISIRLLRRNQTLLFNRGVVLGSGVYKIGLVLK